MKTAQLLLRLPDDTGKADAASRAIVVEEAAPRRGESVRTFLDRVKWDFCGLPTVCRVGNLYYAPEEWASKKIRPTDVVCFIQRPMGGGGGGGRSTGKTIGAAVAMIALAVLAPYAAGAIVGAAGVAGAFGATAAGIASSALATAMIAGGSILISHFLRPKAAAKSDKSDSSALSSFASQSNQARPLQTIPVGYGRRITYPDLSDPTYSEYFGDAQVSYSLLCVGCGEYDIEELRISDTPFWNKTDGILSGFAGFEVEIVPPGEDVTLFPLNVVTASGVSTQELTTTVPPGIIINAPGTQVRQILIDLVFPNGIYLNYTGKYGTIATEALVEVRADIMAVNDAGVEIGTWTNVMDDVIRDARQTQIRMTKRITVTPGRYKIRIWRVNEPLTGTTGANTSYLSAVRAWIDGAQSRPGVTQIAVKTTASPALAGFNNGKIASIQTRKLDYFNTATNAWVFGPTRSISWAIYDIWKNADYCAGLSTDNVDLQRFIDLDTKWATLGHTFDHFFTEPSSVLTAIETVANAGRAYPNIAGDTLSLTRDEPRVIPRISFTDNEIMRGSLTRTAVLYNGQFADGVVGSYLDENTWRPAEVSSAGTGVTLAKPSRVELIGVVKRAQAAGLIRFQAAESMLRRQTIEFQTEMDGLLVRRGDLVAVQSSLPQTWGAAGRIIGYVSGTRTVEISPAPTWVSGEQHYIEFRDPFGGYFGPIKVTRGASDALCIMDSTDLAAVETQTGRTAAQAIERTDTEERPSVVFGIGDDRQIHALVTRGVPNGEHHITLTAVIDADGVYGVDETGIEPLPTIPSFLVDVPPVVTFVTAYAQQSALTMVVRASWAPTMHATKFVAEHSSIDSGNWYPILLGADLSTGLEFALTPPNPQQIKLRVAGIGKNGVMGAWTEQTITVPAMVFDGNTVDFKLPIEVENLSFRAQQVLDDRAWIVSAVPMMALDAHQTAYAAAGAAKAGIKFSQVVKADGESALASLRTDVYATFATNDATYSSQIAALSTSDAAQTASITSLSASYSSIAGTVGGHTTTLATVDSALQALANGNLVAARATLGVTATAGAVLASGLFEITSTSSGTGSTALTTVSLKARAENAWTSAEAAMFLEAYVSGGTNKARVKFKGDSFLLQDSAGNDVFKWDSAAGKFKLAGNVEVDGTVVDLTNRIAVYTDNLGPANFEHFSGATGQPAYGNPVDSGTGLTYPYGNFANTTAYTDVPGTTRSFTNTGVKDMVVLVSAKGNYDYWWRGLFASGSWYAGQCRFYLQFVANGVGTAIVNFVSGTTTTDAVGTGAFSMGMQSFLVRPGETLSCKCQAFGPQQTAYGDSHSRARASSSSITYVVIRG